MSKNKAVAVTARGPYRVTAKGAGVEIGIALLELPLPAKKFVAQCFRLDSDGPSIQLFFGQRLGKRLSAVIGLQIEPTDFRRFYATLSPEFRRSCQQKLASYATTSEGSLRITDDDLSNADPERYAVLTADLGYIEISEGAAIVWYDIPTRTATLALRDANTRLDPPEPIIEIRCSVPLLQLLLDDADHAVARLPVAESEETSASE